MYLSLQILQLLFNNINTMIKIKNHSLIWTMKRIIEKIGVFMRSIKVKILYHTKSKVNILGKVYLNNPNIKFGNNVTLYPNVHILGQGTIEIGDNVVIGDGTIVCAAQDIKIGNDSMVAAQCYIIDLNHGMHLGQNMREQKVSVRPTYIGSDVWVGCGCKILAGSNIADGAVIGAGTVICGEVEAKTICYMERNYIKNSRI